MGLELRENLKLELILDFFKSRYALLYQSIFCGLRFVWLQIIKLCKNALSNLYIIYQAIHACIWTLCLAHEYVHKGYISILILAFTVHVLYCKLQVSLLYGLAWSLHFVDLSENYFGESPHKTNKFRHSLFIVMWFSFYDNFNIHVKWIDFNFIIKKVICAISFVFVFTQSKMLRRLGPY